MNTKRTWSICCTTILLAALLIPSASLQAAQKEKSGVSVGKTAGIGALLGLALGSSVGDVIGGAALGAAGGMVANEVIDHQDKKEAQKQQAAQQQQEAAKQQEASSEAAQKQAEEKARADADKAFAEAIGQDNWEGFKALRGCQHARATALAKAGATSQNEDYRLAALWLEAMVAVDQRDTKSADALYQDVVKQDPDIDTVQQAGMATDKAVLDLRTERRELGLPSCRN